MSIRSAPFFHDEAAAYAKLQSIVWPDGPVCHHCGGVDRITPVRGKTARIGLHRCGDCKRQFRVTVGTVFERSHVPLHQWLQAAYLRKKELEAKHKGAGRSLDTLLSE